MNEHFWNERYKAEEYAYGIKPNEFLEKNSSLIQAKSNILCLAEGEGRNAVFLAKQGHNVTAIDFSIEGLNKAQNLAKKENVQITTIQQDLANYQFEENKWDCIVSVFAHFNPILRKQIHEQLFKSLNPKGILILESYTPLQLEFNTGGPKDIEMLYDEKMLKNDFIAFTDLKINLETREISEGLFHNGKSATIQVIAKK
jgi:2-polyprenyl-3-methyl-5-hydroxy-6-metoxy-1,4-benzoquinol methylase